MLTEGVIRTGSKARSAGGENESSTFLSLLVLAFHVFGLPVIAQAVSDQSATSNVTVVDKKWRVDRRNPALDKDPVEAMNERDRAERQRATERTNEILAERGMPARNRGNNTQSRLLFRAWSMTNGSVWRSESN